MTAEKPGAKKSRASRISVMLAEQQTVNSPRARMIQIVGIWTVVYLVFAVIFLPPAAQAREWKFDKDNFAVTTPDGGPWELAPKRTLNKQIVFRIGDRRTHRVFTVLVSPSNHPERTFDDVMISEFEEQYESIGKKKVRSKKITVAGMPGYECFGQGNHKGQAYSELLHVTAADGQVYMVGIMQFRGNPAMDADLMKMLNSFRFLRTPGVGQKEAFDFYSFESAMASVTLGFVVLLVIALKLSNKRRARERASEASDGAPRQSVELPTESAGAPAESSKDKDLPVPCQCPVCGHQFSNLSEQAGDLVTCPACNVSVRAKRLG